GGHIQSYGRSAEVNNSYIPVIFEFNNTGDVVQGSYADIFLITQDRPNVMTLPLTAITEEQGVHYIYIQVDKEGYRKQEVTLGENDGDRVEILSGLKKGDRVVTKGAIQVKLASASNAIPAHNHNH
ncbi:MAG: efflux RND transporter periplasmic adaptor subunit, partial [Prevotella pectinovora]